MQNIFYCPSTVDMKSRGRKDGKRKGFRGKFQDLSAAEQGRRDRVLLEIFAKDLFTLAAEQVQSGGSHILPYMVDLNHVIESVSSGSSFAKVMKHELAGRL